MRRFRAGPWLCLASAASLSGCLTWDPVSTVSWSPSSGKVAFVSEGRVWVHDVLTGKTARALCPGPVMSLAWSGKEDVLVVSSTTYVALLMERDGVFKSGPVHTLPAGLEDPPILSWHPAGRRLAVGAYSDDSSETYELDIDKGTFERLGRGVGLYGARDWLLWLAQAEVGKRDDKVVIDRQDVKGSALGLDVRTARLLERGLAEMIGILGEPSAGPLCVQVELDEPTRLRVHCMDADGTLTEVATLPGAGTAFPDPGRNLFAVVRSEGGTRTMTVVDSSGAVRLDGAGFTEEMDRSLGLAKDSKDPVRASRAAWSPDGGSIAWVVNGTLGLWDLRTGSVRVERP